MPEHHHLLHKRLIVLACLLIGGCGAGGQLSELPAIRLAGDDMVSPVAEMIANVFEAGHPGATIAYQAMPLPLILESLEAGTLDAAIASQPVSEDHFSTAVGSVTWMASIQPQNTLAAITRDDLQALLQGRQTALGSMECTSVVIGFPEGYAGYEAMKALVPLSKAPASTARLAMDGMAAVRLLAEEPCGLTLLPSFYAEMGIRQVPVLVAPGSESRDYTMISPLYFLSASEPKDAARELLEWILSEEGQAVLATILTPVR